MYGLNNIGALEKATCTAELGLHQPSVLENLKMQKSALVEKIVRVEAAIKALEDNPGAALVIEALSKVNGY